MLADTKAALLEMLPNVAKDSEKVQETRLKKAANQSKAAPSIPAYAQAESQKALREQDHKRQRLGVYAAINPPRSPD